MAGDWTEKVISAEEIAYLGEYRIKSNTFADTFAEAVAELQTDYKTTLRDAFKVLLDQKLEDAIIHGTGNPNTQESLPGKPRLLDKHGVFIKEVLGVGKDAAL